MAIKYKNGSSWVDIRQQIYPVGSIYMSMSSTSPSSLFGGTWNAITDRFLYCNNGTDTGGNNSHTHALSNGYAMINYDTTNSPNIQFGTKKTNWSHTGFMYEWRTPEQINRFPTGNINGGNVVVLGGNSNSSSNMPAYQTIYCWRRTA